MPFHLLVNIFAQFKIIQINYFLNNKVPKFMLDVFERVDNNIINNSFLHLNIFFGELDDFFHDTETILILSKLLKIIAYIVEYLPSNGVGIARNNQIDHMVSLLVF